MVELNKGILIHSLQTLFDEITKRERVENRIFIVKCAYFEIYNDQVFDLLNEQFIQAPESLQVFEDKRKEFVVRDLREVIVESFEECNKLLKLGEMNRSYAETKMNHQSSRSHTLFRLTVQSVIKFDSLDESGGDAVSAITNAVNVQAVLNFIDLAGSERADSHQVGDRNRSPTQGQADSQKKLLKEGKHINKSLFFLTQVIAMRATGTSDHIPYRNSPLTKILKVSLGGNSRTAIILCCTPSMSSQENTGMTLRFG